MKRKYCGRKPRSVRRIIHPRYPGYTVRIAELGGAGRGGKLYAFRQVNGKQKATQVNRTWADLGTTDKERERAARALGFELIEQWANEQPDPTTESSPHAIQPGEVLTLGCLIQQYKARGFFGLTPKYSDEQVAKLNKLAEVIGRDTLVAEVKYSSIREYTAQRQTQGRGKNTIRGDVDALGIAVRWAVKEGLLDKADNPVERHWLPRREQNPRRPRADADRYQALKAVAPRVHPLFGLALDLAWGTGHRIGGIVALKWADILFDANDAATAAAALDTDFGWLPKHFADGGIRWYAGRIDNNKVYEHVVPMSQDVKRALAHAQLAGGGIAGALVFPHPKDPDRICDRYTLGRWLREAERLAEVPHLQGGCWHPFRRGWRTARKHLPAKDVQVLGAWRTDVDQRVYVQADPETVAEIANIKVE